ncbi:MAG: PQQ-binding-like beta-propeller repeat protein [Hyphomicrobiaceae bacterium]
MTIDQLIFVGLNGYALALNRDTGEIVWSNDKLESGPVTLLLDGDRLIASTGGYMFCLDPLTGEAKWNNPLKGYGLAAPAALVSVRGQSPHVLASQQQAASSTATTTAVVAGVVATS